MDVREKLVELLDDIQVRGEDFTDYEIYGMRVPDTVSNEDVASHLIANGVTFATDNNVGDKMTPTDRDTNVLTNADRIRAMSDEELAHELAMVAGWDREQYQKAQRIGLEKVMLDWLKQSDGEIKDEAY